MRDGGGGGELTSSRFHGAFLWRCCFGFVSMRCLPRSVETASEKFPSRLILSYDHPSRRVSRRYWSLSLRLPLMPSLDPPEPVETSSDVPSSAGEPPELGEVAKPGADDGAGGGASRYPGIVSAA